MMAATADRARSLDTSAGVAGDLGTSLLNSVPGKGSDVTVEADVGVVSMLAVRTPITPRARAPTSSGVRLSLAHALPRSHQCTPTLAFLRHITKFESLASGNNGDF